MILILFWHHGCINKKKRISFYWFYVANTTICHLSRQCIIHLLPIWDAYLFHLEQYISWSTSGKSVHKYKIWLLIDAKLFSFFYMHSFYVKLVCSSAQWFHSFMNWTVYGLKNLQLEIFAAWTIYSSNILQVGNSIVLLLCVSILSL